MGEETSETPKQNQKELSPQEDGTKIPLNNEQQSLEEEAKYVPNEKEIKIDVGAAAAFSGLTKEQLLKYSDDPFWVRLRMFLFILFWAAWALMLIMAIVIIVKAPACQPPPEILWIEEEAMIEVDELDLPTAADLKKSMSMIGISSVYFPNLIDLQNFNQSNYNATELIDAIVNEGKHVVTDFPASLSLSNPLFNESFYKEYVDSNGIWNFENKELPPAVLNMFMDSLIVKGIKGFLMERADDDFTQDFKKNLNGLLKEKGAAVGSDILDFEKERKRFYPERFRQFLEEMVGNWSFYKFNPGHVYDVSKMTNDDIRLVTMGLFLYTGTPMLSNFKNVDNKTAELIKYLSEMRSLDGIKIGDANFANTTRNIVAYTRVYKGTPAYAVALNFNNANETISFEGTPNIGATGSVVIHSTMEKNNFEIKDKYDLKKVFIGPFQGLIIQFVADF